MAHVDIVALVSQPPDSYGVLDKPPPAEPGKKRRVEREREALTERYHYVPAKVDYSDLFDILSFFIGSPDGSVPGRDDLAEKIAKRGREYTINNWRYVYSVTARALPWNLALPDFYI